MSHIVYPGFSKTNRWLLYTSFMLAPAQALSGVGSNCPSNIGFLAYNWWTQVSLYMAVNFLFALTYLGGVTSGNIFFGVLLGLGTVGVIVLNTATAWLAWSLNQPEGFGVYQFFFFGWRTLSPGWHKFFLLWQIGDSILAFVCCITAMASAVGVAIEKKETSWWLRYPAIIWGAVVMLLAGWPTIMWTELIVARNHIESATDWVAVWLFVAQVVTMLFPSCGFVWSRATGRGQKA